MTYKLLVNGIDFEPTKWRHRWEHNGVTLYEGPKLWEASGHGC